MIKQNLMLKLMVSFLTLFIIAFIMVVFSITNYLRDDGILPKRDDSSLTCQNLGCPVNATFVGSRNSNVYHECDCSYALAILPENRLCFLTSLEAEDKGYRPGSCVEPFQ